MKEAIEELLKQNYTCSEAFSKLAHKDADNKELKNLLKELITAYTNQHRERLNTASQELDKAHFAFIKAQNELANNLRACFNELLSLGLNDICKDYLEELALSDLSGLQILSEASQSAFINILETAELISERAHAISSYLLISSTTLNSAQILQAAKLILNSALELANLWQSYAQELIYGCIGGLYEALELICERAIKELKTNSLDSSAKQLLYIEDDFRALIASLGSNDYAGGILRSIYDNELSSLSAKLVRAVGRGRCVLGLKFNELISSPQAEQLQLDARAAAAKLLSRLRK